MDNRPTFLERAFALAEDGTVLSMYDLRRRLSEEGFSITEMNQLQGRSLSKQISAKIASARATKSRHA
jgi:hypothetical protein